MSHVDVVRGIKGDKKRAQEIIQSIVSGSPFDRIRESEINGIENRLSRIKEAVQKGDLHLEEEALKELDAGLSIARQTRERAASKQSGQAAQKKAAEVREQAEQPVQAAKKARSGEVTFEEVVEKLGISPAEAARIKADPQKAFKEAYDEAERLRQEAREIERRETVAKKKKALRVK